jgi:hypothetical protein
MWFTFLYILQKGTFFFTEIYTLTMYTVLYIQIIFIYFTPWECVMRTMHEWKLRNLQATEGNEVSICVGFVSENLYWLQAYM